MVEGAPSGEPWRRAERPSHPVAAVAVLVVMTIAVVLLAHGTIVSGSAGIFLAWLAFGVAAMIAILRRVRAPRQVPPTAVEAVIRRDGVSVATDARRHRRFVPARRATTLHMRDGRQIPARIVDISIAGVAVEARLTDLEMMAVSRVGTRAAGPVRRTPQGAVFGFETLLDPQPFDASFVL